MNSRKHLEYSLLASLLLCGLMIVQTPAAPGDLDPSFGNSGRVSSTNFRGYSVATQSDGRIVAVGTSGGFPFGAFTLERYNIDGSLNTSFGSGGRVVTPLSDGMATSVAMAVAIQPDGKILTVGGGFYYFYQDGEIVIYDGCFALARYNTDGSLDTSFGTGGRVITQTAYGIVDIRAVAVQSDGGIVIAGYARGTIWDFFIARYKTNGTLDPSFGSGGMVTTSFTDGIYDEDEANDVTIQPDGKIIAAGFVSKRATPTDTSDTRFAFARYNANGSLDMSFGGGGKVETPFSSSPFGAKALVLRSDGKFLAVGFGGLARYNTSGSLDPTFGSGGIIIGGGGAAAAMQPDGKIIVGGYYYVDATNAGIALAKYNSNGSPDTSFGSGGTVHTPFNPGGGDGASDLAIQPDGKIVVLASSYFPSLVFAVFRYLNNPTPRPTFDFDGDRKTDLSIFRPNATAGAEWWWLKSSTGGNGAVQFGAAADKIVPADYTGDGKTDVAFWRPWTGQWFVLRSEDFSFYAFPFGATGDVPVPGDYDGDGKADAAVFRESSLTWFISKSSGGTDIVGFGASGDKPVNADYDGDGKTDIAIYRPNGASGSEWWIRRSSNLGVFATQFGQPADKAVAGDYTGDGKADIAFWTPSSGNWFVLRSEDFSYYAFPFGASTDVPVPGDYDGDGKLDAAVFRPSTSTWFANRSTAGVLIQQFGIAGDVPVPNAFVR